LGITQFVVALNKMDAVAYDEDVFRRLCRDLRANVLHPLGLSKAPVIPVSALEGDNVFSASEKMRWYDGLAFIDALDACIVPSTRAVDRPLRGFVQDVYKRKGEEIIVCKIESGVVRQGNLLHFSPSEREGRLRMIEFFGAKPERAYPGDSVGLIVDGVQRLKRGEVVSHPEDRPPLVRSFTAEIVLFSNTTIGSGDVLTLHHGTIERKCRVQEIVSEIDPVNLTRRPERVSGLRSGGVGEVRLYSSEAFPLERYSDSPQMGRFVVIGGKGAIGAGIVVDLKR